MTCALNEVACAAFAVGALIDLVDLYVFVDTGSSDGTADLIEHLYEREVEAGRLVIDRLGPLPDHDVSLARGHALERFRAADIGAFLKVDADDVFYDAGANQMVELLRTFPAGTTHASGRSRELYQSEIVDTDEWLRALRDGRDVFWEMDLLPSHDRGFAVAGARARGKWGDEAAGRPPEGIGYA